MKLINGFVIQINKTPKKWFVLLFFINFLMSSISFSDQMSPLLIEADKKLDSTSLEPYMQLFIDPSQGILDSDILKSDQQSRFVPILGRDVFPFERASFWLKFSLINASKLNILLNLRHENAYTDEIILYKQDREQLIQIGRQGDLVASEADAQAYRLPIFQLDLTPGMHTFYLRLKTLGPTRLKFSLWTPEAHFQHGLSEYFLLGLLFGFVLVMLGYNFFLAIRLGNRSYYYYVAYIAFFGLVQLFFTGMAQYFLPSSELTRFLVNQGIVLAAELAAIFGSLFAVSFLNIKQTFPVIYKFFLCFYPLSLLNMLIVFIDYDLSIRLVLLTNAYVSVCLLMAGIHGCWRGYRPAYFFLMAWGILILGSLMSMARIYGFVPDSPITLWSQFIGGTLETLLLSLALGDKISLEQELASSEISKLNKHLHTANSNLKHQIENVESIVEAKTRDIKSMLSHIHQGIFLLSGENGLVMPEYSEHLTSILETKKIVGQSIRQLLFDRSYLTEKEVLKAEQDLHRILSTPLDDFEASESSLIQEMVYRVGNTHDKILELEWCPIGDKLGAIEKILVTIRDVSMLRQLQIQKDRQQKALAEAEQAVIVQNSKMRALSEMSSGVAHEVNNPLMIIGGYSEMLIRMSRQDTIEPSKIQHYASHIIATVERIAYIVQSLQTFARSEDSQSLSPLSMQTLLSKVLALCESRINAKGIRLELKSEVDALQVEAHEAKLIQVFLGLIDNAILAVENADNKWIEINLKGNSRQDKKVVCVAILDSGSGVSIENRSRLFQPFFTTRLVGKGAGLSLSQALGILQSFGGSIAFDEQSAHTCFRIELPRIEPTS